MLTIGAVGVAGALHPALSVDVANAQQRLPHVSSQTATGRYALPLKSSRNGRYLVDQNGRPFLVVGDSPQALITNVARQDAAAFIANRKAAGFNTLWVNLLCGTSTGCPDDGATYDGVAPFLSKGDLSSPNPRYFTRAQEIVHQAATAGIVVFLDPIETASWLGVLRSNGVEKDRAFGRYVGRLFRKYPNVVWLNGNDFQSWSNPADDSVALAVAQGIRSVDARHLQTVELNYYTSASRDDPRWRSLSRMNSVYTYHPTYAKVSREYHRTPPQPAVMLEAGYEFEQNTSWISKGTPEILRRQAYWSVLAGAAGQFYGNGYTWKFADGWKQHLDTPGSRDIGHLADLLEQRPWFRLVPDTKHQIVTAGFGTFTASGSVAASNYVTTAATPDRRLSLSYLPSGGTLTVDATHLASGTRARWYDPSSGRYSPAKPTKLPREHAVHLTAPGDNADGDPDWVLVLAAS
jgi:hypothetical protein